MVKIVETPRRPEKHHAYQMTQLHCSSESFASPPLPTTRRRGSQIEQISANISGMELVSAMAREMQSRARHGWQAVQGSAIAYSKKWQRWRCAPWTSARSHSYHAAESDDRENFLCGSGCFPMLRLPVTCSNLQLGRIRPYPTPPDPRASGTSTGPVCRAAYTAPVAHEEAPARVCLKCCEMRHVDKSILRRV